MSAPPAAHHRHRRIVPNIRHPQSLGKHTQLSLCRRLRTRARTCNAPSTRTPTAAVITAAPPAARGHETREQIPRPNLLLRRAERFPPARRNRRPGDYLPLHALGAVQRERNG